MLNFEKMGDAEGVKKEGNQEELKEEMDAEGRVPTLGGANEQEAVDAIEELRQKNMEDLLKRTRAKQEAAKKEDLGLERDNEESLMNGENEPEKMDVA